MTLLTGTSALARFVTGCVGGTVHVAFHDAVASWDPIKFKGKDRSRVDGDVPMVFRCLPFGASLHLVSCI
jgi:hypothetical protein